MESFREVRTILVPLAEDVEDPSMYKIHDGISDVGSSTGSSGGTSCVTLGFSFRRVHSAMKSAKI